MPTTLASESPTFVDRRSPETVQNHAGRERRQFSNSHNELSPDAADLARAIDRYKLQHRRRFINFEEMLSIFKALGYSK